MSPDLLNRPHATGRRHLEPGAGCVRIGDAHDGDQRSIWLMGGDAWDLAGLPMLIKQTGESPDGVRIEPMHLALWWVADTS